MSRVRYEQALERFEQGDFHAALDKAERALKDKKALEADPDLEIDLRLLAIDALLASGRSEEVFGHTQRLRTLAPDLGIVRLTEAIAHWTAWRIENARRALDGLELEGDDQAELLSYRARLCEMDGRLADADRLYAQAAELAPETFPMPIRLTRAEVDEAVQSVIGQLPPPVQTAIKGLVIEVVPMPSVALHKTSDSDPELLGLYQGQNILERSATEGPPSVDRVFLFQRNIERVCADRQQVAEQIGVTLLHEIGHHLGLEEDDMEERGLE